jgi:hypothetical protein
LRLRLVVRPGVVLAGVVLDAYRPGVVLSRVALSGVVLSAELRRIFSRCGRRRGSRIRR